MVLDILASIGGMVIPPVFDFIKKKFIKSENDNANATLNTLATTKPDVMPAFIQAQSQLLESQVKFYNRDVIGTIPVWVSAFRALIRPVFVWVSALVLFADIFLNVQIDDGLRQFMEIIVSNWFGSRLT